MRRPNIIRPIKLTTTFPEDIRAKLDLHLYSPVEHRVPQGAIQKFLVERVQEYFSYREMGKEAQLDIPEDLPDPGRILDKTLVQSHEGKVIVQFPTNRKGLSLKPEQALIFASAIISAAKECK